MTHLEAGGSRSPPDKRRGKRRLDLVFPQPGPTAVCSRKLRTAVRSCLWMVDAWEAPIATWANAGLMMSAWGSVPIRWETPHDHRVSLLPCGSSYRRMQYRPNRTAQHNSVRRLPGSFALRRRPLANQRNLDRMRLPALLNPSDDGEDSASSHQEEPPSPSSGGSLSEPSTPSSQTARSHRRATSSVSTVPLLSIKGPIRFPPFEDLDDVSVRLIQRFDVRPFGAIIENIKPISYNSDKRSLKGKTGLTKMQGEYFGGQSGVLY